MSESGGRSETAGQGLTERTFLIADIRGYTRFTRERGVAAAGRLAGAFAELARDAVEARGGRVIELRGDEALAVFSSPASAVRAATELVAVCAEEATDDLPLNVGVGLDLGDASPLLPRLTRRSRRTAGPSPLPTLPAAYGSTPPLPRVGKSMPAGSRTGT
jgi:hypothetical protein